ncbi:RimK family alpha-L-glutamate ligase [Paralcaligenes sp. KSB-10]|uniref:ATP-grasp domain-containing protein n=1 Tax=Paralcaligenes sp. KSB-10 TaxID=2901142 RepID=UPI001E56C9B8|nr:RimK family alpha-L-glutamate ligase [Paralcaligenes sp. KSB-10]UHL63263.1 RimK family alpha-L-glutamate ligase [Paralcaligenes sp. KSB-10]
MHDDNAEHAITPKPESAATKIPPLIGMAPLIRRAFNGENLVPMAQKLLARAQENPLDAHACLDLSAVLLITGHRKDALAIQAEALAMQSRYFLPARHAKPGLRLLVLMGPGDFMANTPVEFLVEDSDVSLELLYLGDKAELPASLPDHDVLMVAMAESDANLPLLKRLEKYLDDWPNPVINRPEHIVKLSRNGVYAALQGLPGVEIPASVRIDRSVLQALSNGETAITDILPDGDFPIIVRPLGSHAGNDLEKLERAEDFAAYLHAVGDEYFYVSRFVDYRGADGLFRKYRIAMIDGQPFVCHFAVSEHWMIHYLNAGMVESAEKRMEEAACMATFDDDFAVRHAAALQAIDQRIGLPYMGMDCAETASGELLIFEVDNSMIVHAMDPEDLFPYKAPAMRKVFAAFREMLEKARVGTKS